MDLNDDAAPHIFRIWEQQSCSAGLARHEQRPVSLLRGGSGLIFRVVIF